MACVGRTSICTIVPPNHFGPVPGVPVGSLWKFRVQVIIQGLFHYCQPFAVSNFIALRNDDVRASYLFVRIFHTSHLTHKKITDFENIRIRVDAASGRAYYRNYSVKTNGERRKRKSYISMKVF